MAGRLASQAGEVEKGRARSMATKTNKDKAKSSRNRASTHRRRPRPHPAQRRAGRPQPPRGRRRCRGQSRQHLPLLRLETRAAARRDHPSLRSGGRISVGRQAGRLLRRAEASGLPVDRHDPRQPTARPARHRRGRNRRPDAAIRGGTQRLRQDVIDGDIDRAHDLEALQVALSALLRGYRIFREPYAKRIDTDVDDLDERDCRNRTHLARSDGASATTGPDGPALTWLRWGSQLHDPDPRTQKLVPRDPWRSGYRQGSGLNSRRRRRAASRGIAWNRLPSV